MRYIIEYSCYLLWSSLLAIVHLLRSRYGIIQVFLLPEPLVIAALIPKLFGVRVVSDWMDLGDELYRSKYHARSRYCDALRLILRISEHIVVSISDLIIFPNAAFPDALSKRGIKVFKYRVILNAADSDLFALSNSGSRNRADRLLFTGTISERNGVQVLLEAFRTIKRLAPDCSLTLLGTPIDANWTIGFSAPCTEAGVHFVGRVPHSAVPDYLHNADIGVIPTSDTPFTRCTLPTRLFEFGAAGLPVVCADLPGIRQYFDDRHLLFHRPDDSVDLSNRILQLIADAELRKCLARRLQERCLCLSWTRFKQDYLESMMSLAS